MRRLAQTQDGESYDVYVALSRFALEDLSASHSDSVVATQERLSLV